MKKVGKIAKWFGILIYAACAVLIVMFLMPFGGWKALDVLTGSMKPAIQPGDLVIIHRVPLRDIHPGDIVTYTKPTDSKLTITHRVVSKELKDGIQTITTKGDANAAADPPFFGGHIVGKVVFQIPLIGRLLDILRNPYGLVAIVVVPGIIVIWAEVRNLRRVLRPETKPQANAEPDLPPRDEPPSAPQAPTLAQAKTTRRPARRLDNLRPKATG